MKHFLLVFDRSRGETLSVKAYTDAGEALGDRFRTERLHKDNPDIEVVVLTAQSKHALKLTHARYFHSLAQLAAGASKSAKQARAAQ